MPAGAESLASLLVERMRHYERNCRCPKCHGAEGGPLACIDCEFCVANLRKLMLAELTKPAGVFFSCVAQTDRGNLPSMKKSTGKSSLKVKSRSKTKVTGKAKKALKKPVAKAVAGARKPMVKASTRAEKKKPVSIAAGRAKGGDSDRGLYVRFESPAVKATVMAAAAKTGVSMNAYIAAATLDWVEKKKELANPKDAAATERVAATG